MPASENVPGKDGRGLRHFVSRLRSYLIIDPLIFGYTAICGALSLLFSFVDRDGRIQHAFARHWAAMILRFSMTEVTVIHPERLGAAEDAVVVANHLSAMDIPLIYSQLPFPFRIVAKKELFSYPFVGWHLRRSGQVAIDSSSPRATFKSLNSAVDDLHRGLSVVIFPEGGRSPNGEMLPFMNGAFYVAVKAQKPIVPVALVGTYEMLPMNTFHIMPRPLKMAVGEPIPTKGLTLRDLESLAERARRAVDALYLMNREARVMASPSSSSSSD